MSTSSGAGPVIGPVYSAVYSFLSGQPWALREEPARNLIRFEAGAWSTCVVAFEEAQQVAIYSVVPLPIPAERRGVIAELITRANFGLVIGNFELDFSDGEARFKTSLDFEGGELAEALLRQLLRANLSVMTHYLPAFVAVLVEQREPAAALSALDGGNATAGLGGSPTPLAEARDGFGDDAVSERSTSAR